MQLQNLTKFVKLSSVLPKVRKPMELEGKATVQNSDFWVLKKVALSHFIHWSRLRTQQLAEGRVAWMASCLSEQKGQGIKSATRKKHLQTIRSLVIFSLTPTTYISDEMLCNFLYFLEEIRTITIHLHIVPFLIVTSPAFKWQLLQLWAIV